MTRKLLVLLAFLALLAAESAFFGRQAAAGILRLRGQRAFLRNDESAAWGFYHRALALGGQRKTLESDLAELLLMGLDQEEAGTKVVPALPTEKAVRETIRLLARRIGETPFGARSWSLLSDAYFHEGRLERGQTPLDISTLSDDPLDILLPVERLGLAALRTAAALEPTNYLYQDLLAEKFLQIGSISQAVIFCRKSVASLPVLPEHEYLQAPDLDPELLEAAVRGFEDARLEESIILPDRSESDAGWLLWNHGQTRRSIEFLQRAATLSPNNFEARSGLGIANYTLGDYEGALRELKEAIRIQPENPTPHVHMGLSYIELGNLPAAIDEFRSAREKDNRGLKYFLLLGEALEKAGQIRQAERQFVAGANVNPGTAEAWSALLFFYTRHRDLRPASDACSRLQALKAADSAYRAQCASLGMDVP